MHLRRLIAVAAAVAVTKLAYLRYGRARVRDWGATSEEAAAQLPGDDILPGASLQTTRAITVDAAPEFIWPWLLQMGPQPRAGVYTYDWIERLLGLDIKNSDRILPEFQHLEPGECLRLDASKGLLVRAVEPPRALVFQWQPAGSTWAFVLHGQADSARLISRNRIAGSGPLFWLMAVVMEPASLVMEHKMLLGIKQRAEKLSRERFTPAPSQ
jgi:hypothetical protein